MTLDMLLALQKLAARLKFPTISERWVESRHAIMKRYLMSSPHASAMHLVYTGVLPLLRQTFTEDPDAFASLAQMCTSARTPRRCLEALGLKHHAAVQRLLQGTPTKNVLDRDYKPALVEIIYHCDRETLYQDSSLPCGQLAHSNLSGLNVIQGFVFLAGRAEETIL